MWIDILTAVTLIGFGAAIVLGLVAALFEWWDDQDSGPRGGAWHHG